MSRNLIGKKTEQVHTNRKCGVLFLGLFKMTLCPLDLASASPRLPEEPGFLGAAFGGSRSRARWPAAGTVRSTTSCTLTLPAPGAPRLLLLS